MTERKCLWCGTVRPKAELDRHAGEYGMYYYCPECPSGETDA